MSTVRAAGSQVKIDLSQQRAYLYSGGQLVMSAPVSSGRAGHRTGAGNFRVLSKQQFHRSTYYGDYVDASGHVVKSNVDARRSRRPAGARFRGAAMPYYIKFTGNSGLHLGKLPGYPASHGCIRLPPEQAKVFFDTVSVGTPVTVTR